MPKASVILKCVDCGKEFPRKELNRKFRCLDCAWEKLATVAWQLYKKEGPEYEHWKERCRATASRYTEGIEGG